MSLSENESARCSTRRESWLRYVEVPKATMPSASAAAGSTAGAPGARLGRAPALGQPGGREQRRRRHERQVQQAAGHVAVVHVTELVRDDEVRLGPREALEQRVVEDDALGAPRGR